jgi:hypothetical protein
LKGISSLVAVEVSSLELVLVLSFSAEVLGLFSLEEELEPFDYVHELGTLTETPATTF